MRIAVIDSSSKLALYFDVIYVPRNVQLEFNRKHRSRYQLNKLLRDGVFQKCKFKDETNFQLLSVELDAGEAEGLVQAQERGAEFFLVDERKAREFGARRGLTLYGTARLLARLCLEGYAEDIWALVRRLRKERRFRVDDEVIRNAIASAEMPIGRFFDEEDGS